MDEKLKPLINVPSVERRVQALENRLVAALRAIEQMEIRLDAQLGRILELETLELQRQEQAMFVFDPHEHETPAGEND